MSLLRVLRYNKNNFRNINSLKNRFFNQSLKMSSISYQNISSNQIYQNNMNNNYQINIYNNLNYINKRYFTLDPTMSEEEVWKTAPFRTLCELQKDAIPKFSDQPLFGTKVFRDSNDEVGTWEWMTYGEFDENVKKFQLVLKDMGVGFGDRVAVISANRAEWAIGAYATYNLGAIWVPMYEQQAERDWHYILKDSGAKILISSKNDIYNQIKKWEENDSDLPELNKIYGMDLSEDHESSFWGSIRSKEIDEKVLSKIKKPSPHDLCTIIYTSGTTGNPKGVEIMHWNLSSNIYSVTSVLPSDIIEVGKRSVSFLPWAHIYGQTAELHMFIANGACMALNDDVLKIIDNFKTIKPNIINSVPRLFKRIYDNVNTKIEAGSPIKQKLFHTAMSVSREYRETLENNKKPSLILSLQHTILKKLVIDKIRAEIGGNLDIAVSGGAACPAHIVEFMDNIGIRVIEGYGLTETSPICTLNSTVAGKRKPGTVGIAVGGVTTAIILNGMEVNNGEEGEVCVSGPNVMKGYRNNPNETAKVLFEYNGKTYFRTGDLGRIVDNKFLQITGRIKEQYKLENGKYVAPDPIENAIISSRFLQQAILYGDNRPYNIALLVPDWLLLKDWALKNTSLTENVTESELTHHPSIHDLIRHELNVICERVRKYERPKRWVLIEEPFSIENNMLTPKLSVKRRIVLKAYGDTIEDVYNGKIGIEQNPTK